MYALEHRNTKNDWVRPTPIRKNKEVSPDWGSETMALPGRCSHLLKSRYKQQCPPSWCTVCSGRDGTAKFSAKNCFLCPPPWPSLPWSHETCMGRGDSWVWCQNSSSRPLNVRQCWPACMLKSWRYHRSLHWIHSVSWLLHSGPLMGVAALVISALPSTLLFRLISGWSISRILQLGIRISSLIWLYLMASMTLMSVVYTLVA